MTAVAKLNEVLKLAADGMHVFPCEPNGKRPLGALVRNGQNDATTDRRTIMEWWQRRPDANVGVSAEKSGLYVVDLDCHNGAPGFETWASLTVDREVPATYTVRTPSGGLHLYFVMPSTPLKNTAGKRGLGEGIDTRGNGYVVAPPSTIGGAAYTVVKAMRPAPLPQWIVDALAPRIEPARIVVPRPSTPATAGDVYARVRELSDELSCAPRGCGNATAASKAFMAGQYVGAGQLSEDDAKSIMLDGISSWSYDDQGDEHAMQRTIIRAVMEGAKRPRAWEAPRTRAVEVRAVPPAPRELLDDEAPADVEGPAEDAPSTGDAPATVTDWATDDGQARFLRDRLPQVRYVLGIGWHLWDGTRWEAVDSRRVAALVMGEYEGLFSEASARWTRTMDDKHLAAARTYKAFMGATRRARILESLAALVLLDADQLDTHPELLNTPGGVVDLRTGSVRPHDPDLYLTRITSGSYRAGMTHADWDAALTALPEEIGRYMQVRVGNAATGYLTDDDDAVFLAGCGANGKSLMMTDGVFRALGSYAQLASEGLILAKSSAGGASPERASLQGARLVLLEELPEGRSLSVEEMKRITGTSVITARRLYGNEFTFKASHSLFVTTNYLPRVNETDDGSWRRLCLVNFPYRFRSNPEAEDERQGDPGLKLRLREGRDGQHDAIVTWIVEGARRYLADRKLLLEEQRPQTVKDDKLEWQKSSDRILAYFDERLDPHPEGVVERGDLYEDFSSWLAMNGHSKWSQELFYERFKKHALSRLYGVGEGRLSNSRGLSRPAVPSNVVSFSSRAVPSRPRVFTGIVFADGRSA